MRKSLLVLSLVGFWMCAGTAQAAVPPWFETIIAYDGYVERQGGFFSADTLFVINNTDPTDMMDVWFEVFDKHGKLVWEGIVWDGGVPIARVVPNGFGWITLGMVLDMVNRDTRDPFGNIAGEKFYVRISAAHQASNLNLVPSVEVKQVLYNYQITLPQFAIWQPWYIRSWAETGLGGNRHATGVIWPK